MHDNFLGFWNKIDKNCQEFIYSWKVSKIQHAICPYNERNFFTFYLILINSPTDGITLQLFSIRWTTTDFEILRNMNNYRKLLFSCSWSPHFLFCPMHFCFQNSWSISLKRKKPCTIQPSSQFLSQTTVTNCDNATYWLYPS